MEDYASASKADFFDQDTRNMLARMLEERITAGKYSVFFGGSTFTKYVMTIDRELQFSEIIAKIKMLERQGADWSKDSLFGHDIQKVVIQKRPNWTYFRLLQDEESAVLVNDRKLLVYFNYVEGLIVRYSLVQIEG